MTNSQSEPASPWPVELTFRKASSDLLIRFDDGLSAELPFELLRVESPSAETRGHGSDRPPPPSGKQNVQVSGVDPVGRYAIRIRFSDGHDTGIYSWEFLRELGEHKDDRTADYLKRLEESGGSRN